ncbi:hypothetical protein [Acinetobacter gerneri]|nr:hypothetical protein [Acinetobacter gerneri]MCH4245168.1 hypothetical protein [Acinetobacter gerneri]
MEKKFLLLSMFFCMLSLAACNNSTDNLQSNVVKKVDHQTQKKQLSKHDQDIIEQYNQIMRSFGDEDNKVVLTKLKNLIPEVKQIENSSSRNMIIMDIYLRLEMYQEAYDLNENKLKNKPTILKLQYKCMLMDKLHKDVISIQTCNQNAANTIKTMLDTTSKEDKMYPYAQWAYYISMYKAGHKEYDIIMQKFIESQTDEIMKRNFESLYESEVEPLKTQNASNTN